MNKFERVSKAEYEKAMNDEKKSLSYEEIQIPRRATSGSAGYDFFSPISFELEAGKTIKIPTGIKCALDAGNVLLMFPRSSYGFKYRMQLDNTVGVIDQDYYNNESNEGHIFIKITNDSKNGSVLKVNCGDSFAQGIIMPFIITDDDETRNKRTGGIGSTTQM